MNTESKQISFLIALLVLILGMILTFIYSLPSENKVLGITNQDTTSTSQSASSQAEDTISITVSTPLPSPTPRVRILAASQSQPITSPPVSPFTVTQALAPTPTPVSEPAIILASAPTPAPLEPNTTSTLGALVGNVTLSPTCSVVTWPSTESCFSPYEADIAIKTADGTQTITTTRSNSTGYFSLALPAGTYLVVPVEKPKPSVMVDGMEITNSSSYPNAASQIVTIIAGSATTIDIKFDSGIR